jgi:two-component system, OmpR family, phosphate regulon sensor histidine kinase PhoR
LKWSLRTRLLATFLVLVAVVGAVTLFAIERTLAGDLRKSLDARLVYQGKGVAQWLDSGDRAAGPGTGSGDGGGNGGGGGPGTDTDAEAARVDRIAERLGRVIGARITIFDADGFVEGDSSDRIAGGTVIDSSPEVVAARKGQIGRDERALVRGESPYYLVAVPAANGRIVRLAWPLSDVIATRQRMRNRLIVGSILGFIGALVLSAIALRAIVRPLQSMTRTAARLAKGDYDVAPPAEAVSAGGELAVLAHSLTHLAGEVKTRIGELTRQRDLLGGVVSTLVEGVIVLDAAGSVVLVNEAAEPLVGDARPLPAPLAPLVDGALADVRDRGYRPPTRPGSGDGAAPHEAEITLRDRAVRASALPLPSGGAIVVLYDVTRLRALEGQSREFLASAAHELRTPVTAISGSAETLLSGAADAETAAEFLSVIHRNSQRIARLVSDLLVLEGLGARAAVVGQRDAIALHPVCTDAARTAHAISPDVRIDVEVPPELLVMGTRDGLDHVVQNLVDNAVKHGGPQPVTVRASVVGRRVRLEIVDRGPGIAPEHQPRVFERFYRIDAGRSRAKGGSGLGLAIVRSQAEAMNGAVHVESELGKGATFVVELDLADEEALRRESKRTGPSPAIPGET